MRRIGVFCGSKPGREPAYVEAAVALGTAIARRGLGLVYGGGGNGMMGALADAALAAGGEVIGVIPRALFRREHLHQGITEVREVASLLERKALMAELADGFVVLPGGIGTLDELFEMWTWTQLGIHAKRCTVLDVGGYYRPLLAFLDRVTEQGYLSRAQRDSLTVSADPEGALAAVGWRG